MQLFRFAAFSAVALLGFASVVSAADLPTKAPGYKAPLPALAYNWTGFYIGLNAGGSIGRDPTTQSRESFQFASFTMSPAGFVGGGQIGYNWQFAPNWLIGLEGDFQGATQSDSSCVGGCGNTPVITTAIIIGPSSFYYTATQKVKWFATARARLGYTDGDWLWYVTGGAAWAEVHNDFAVFTPFDVAGSANFNQSGWVIGAGVETHLGGGWTAKAEYLNMDLGSLTDSVYDPNTQSNFTMTSDIRDHIVRVGLNYKFN